MSDFIPNRLWTAIRMREKVQERIVFMRRGIYKPSPQEEYLLNTDPLHFHKLYREYRDRFTRWVLEDPAAALMNPEKEVRLEAIKVINAHRRAS